MINEFINNFQKILELSMIYVVYLAEVIERVDDYLIHINHIEPLEIEALILKYWEDIWNYAFVLTNKHDVADDIAQDTFINAFLSVQGFRGQSTVKTWLLKICRNQVINYKRSAFFRRMVPVAFVMTSAESASAESTFFANSMVDAVWKHLLALPCKYREVLLLEIRYSFSYEEMADFLGITEGTVKSRLHRARAKMRKKIEEEKQ
jgi:RNA polymerase sigma-70 factor, ECF subfamily